MSKYGPKNTKAQQFVIDGVDVTLVGSTASAKNPPGSRSPTFYGGFYHLVATETGRELGELSANNGHYYARPVKITAIGGRFREMKSFGAAMTYLVRMAKPGWGDILSNLES